MPNNRIDDRAWAEAIDRYARRAPQRPGGHGQGRYVLASAAVLALMVSPFAIGATGSVLREGKRNPGSGRRQARDRDHLPTKTYGTRQSNMRDGNGGGAIYGCRSNSGREPCIRANNLKTGRAFEFETDGDEAGRIETKTDGGGRSRPTRPGWRRD